ncbi:MAG: translation initiation factor IF-2 [Candidatus Bathyarchaeia archaeon]
MDPKSIRQPVVAILGHVDHGKTTLLDKIRGTTVALREPGSMTQWIGASLIPAEVLAKICGPLLEKFRFEIVIPGLLFIDTPGHETFSNLRRRGGSAADIAILVIDVVKGVEPQTVESLEILRDRRVPFLVAANKIDVIPGWRTGPSFFTESLKLQPVEAVKLLDEHIYRIMGDLSLKGFQAERFDRVRDFKRQVAIVPTSARSGEGIPELLAVLVGLTQAYMRELLKVTPGPGRAVVLEVKEELGLGVTLNIILYDGKLRVNDRIVLGGRDRIIDTRVRAILVPKPLDEIRDPRDRFNSVGEVNAAAGVKIAAPGLEDALAGSPLYVIPEEEPLEDYKRRIMEEIEQLRIRTDRIGVVVKADTLGSLEAMIDTLRRLKIPIRLADVGDVSRRDVVEAEAVRLKDPILGVILSFNVRVLPDAEKELADKDVPLFASNILFRLIEEYEEWAYRERLSRVKAELDSLVRPGKLKVLRGYVFRRSKPAIVGVEVLAGRIRAGYPLISMKGRHLGNILKIQDKGLDVEEAVEGSKVAVSISEGVIGRNLDEDEVLLVDVPPTHADILLRRFKDILKESELEALRALQAVKERPE